MKRYPYVIGKAISFWWRSWDNFRQMLIFPLDSVRAWRKTIVRGGEVVREVRGGLDPL